MLPNGLILKLDTFGVVNTVTTECAMVVQGNSRLKISCAFMYMSVRLALSVMRTAPLTNWSNS